MSILRIEIRPDRAPKTLAAYTLRRQAGTVA
jgi:hypothetical protein